MTDKLISDQAISETIEFLQSSQNLVAAARAARVRAESNTERTLAMLMLRSPEASPEMRRAWAIAHIDYSAACVQEAQAVKIDEWNRVKMNNVRMILEARSAENGKVLV